MFTWEKKNRLSEQLKFFNATKKRFISCYAKKPRIRIEKKEDKRLVFDFNPRYAINYAQQDRLLAALGARGQASTANMQFLGGNAANIAAQQQMIGLQNANNLMQQGMNAARGDLSGGAGGMFGGLSGLSALGQFR